MGEAVDLGWVVGKDHQLQCGPGERQLPNRQDTHYSAESQVLSIYLNIMPLTKRQAHHGTQWELSLS